MPEITARTGRAAPAGLVDRAVRGEDPIRLLAETAGDLLYLYRVHPQPRYEYVSPSAEAITGFGPAEHYADPELLLKMCHPQDRPLLASLLRTPAAFSQPVTLRLIRKDGRQVWTEHRIAAIFDTTSNVVAIQGIARDVTARRASEEELWRTVQSLRRANGERGAMLGLLAEAEHKERRELAEGLHDDALQVLTAALLRLQVFRRRLDDPERAAELVTVEDALRRGVDRLRRLSFELRPPTLDGEGFASAIRVYLDRWRRDGGPTVELADHLRTEPAKNIRIVLYRIAQEALTNVRKHAGASSVHVVLDERDGGYLMRVADDGVGFASGPHPGPSAGGLGMTAMREQAEFAGGWWRVDSAPGAGTTVEFWVPSRTHSTPGSGRPG